MSNTLHLIGLKDRFHLIDQGRHAVRCGLLTRLYNLVASANKSIGDAPTPDIMSLVGEWVRGRSQLSTFMKAYTAYARGRGSGTTVRLSPPKINILF